MFFPTLYKFYPDLILIYLDEIRINWAQNQDKIKIKGHGRASTTLTKKNVIWTLSEAKDPNRKNFWRNTLCQRQSTCPSMYYIPPTTNSGTYLWRPKVTYALLLLLTKSVYLYLCTYLGYRGVRRCWMYSCN